MAFTECSDQLHSLSKCKASEVIHITSALTSWGRVSLNSHGKWSQFYGEKVEAVSSAIHERVEVLTLTSEL